MPTTTWLMPRLSVHQRRSRQLNQTNLNYSVVQVPCPVTKCEWDIDFFLNLETMVGFDGSRFIVKRPTKTSKANLQPQPEVPADIESIGTTPRQRGQPSGSRVLYTEEEDEVAPFETPRVLKKAKQRVEPASEIDEEENKEKLVKMTTGQNKGKNKERDNPVSYCVVIL